MVEIAQGEPWRMRLQYKTGIRYVQCKVFQFIFNSSQARTAKVKKWLEDLYQDRIATGCKAFRSKHGWMHTIQARNKMTSFIIRISFNFFRSAYFLLSCLKGKPTTQPSAWAKYNIAMFYFKRTLS